MDASTQHATALQIVHEEAGRTLSKADFDLCMRIAKRALDALASDAAGAPIIAWATEDDRVITDRQKQHALAEGGASASSVKPFSVPLYAAPVAPAAPLTDEHRESIEYAQQVLRQVEAGDGTFVGQCADAISGLDAILAAPTVAADAAAPTCMCSGLGPCEQRTDGSCRMKATAQPDERAAQWPNPVAWRDKHETSDLYARMPNPEQVEAEALYTAGQVREMLARAASPQSGEKDAAFEATPLTYDQALRALTDAYGRGFRATDVTFRDAVGPLSARLRPGIECAPWVVEEVKKLEARSSAPQAVLTEEQRAAIQECIDYLSPAAKEFAYLGMPGMGDSKHARCIRALRALLTQAPTEHMSDAAREEEPSWTNPLTPYGMLVRALRIVAGTTLMDMATFLECRPAQLSALEFGRKPVTNKDIVGAAHYFASLGIQSTTHALTIAARKAEIERGGSDAP